MTDDILTLSFTYGIISHKKGRDYMAELILLLLLVFIVLPVAVISGIVLLIVRLIRRYKNRNSPEQEKIVRNFSGSEIMFIIGTIFIVLSGIAFGCAGWVNTSPVGRVLIMFSAAVTMSGAGELFRRKLKLDGTATAFGVIGTVLLAVTVITAGYYELFGKWFSVDGDGQCMLFALSSLIVSVASYAESKLNEKDAFKYLLCMSLTTAIIFLSGQITDDYGMFAVMMTVIQTAVTAWLIFGKTENDIIKKSVKLSAVIFSVLAFAWVIDRILVPDGATYFIMLITLVQLIGYGIYLNNPILKSLQSILSVLTAFVFVNDVQNDDNQAIILFSAIMLFIYSANRFIPHLKNRFSEIFTLGFAVYSAVASATLDEPTAVIIPVIISGLIMLYSFSESRFVQTAAGLCSPILPVIIAENHDSYEILAIVLCLVTAGIICLPKYAFKLYADFPRKSDMILYTNMFVSGIINLLLIADSPDNLFIALTACGMHILVSLMLKNNFTGILSCLSAMMIICELDIKNYQVFVLFCLLEILSRMFFRDGVILRKNYKTRFDIITFSVWTMLRLMESDFLGFMFIAIYSANFVRRKTNKTTAKILLPVSAFLTMLAMNNRPFFIPESEIIENKITLGLIALIGVAYRYIWKNSPKISKNLSDVIFILSFAGLIFDVMEYHKIGNTIFGLAVTAVILIISFSAKNRKWFGVSSVALLTITIWSSAKYFGKLDWWVYLFIAGILFIAIASVNEYLKSNDKKISDIFKNWK